MTPAARISAITELLDVLLTSWMQEKRIPADRLIDQYFKARRFIGSHDRGAVSEFVYWVIRHKSSLEWHCAKLHVPVTPRTLTVGALLLRKDISTFQLATLFDGGKYSPRVLSDGEWQFAQQVARQEMKHADMPHGVRLNYPQWMEPHLRASLGPNIGREMEAMQNQAPVDLRVNTLKTTRETLLALLREAGYEAEPTAISDLGIRLKKREPIFGSEPFKQGFFEMQDAGSQAVAALVDAKPGMKVIDFCAGAGGKTLAVAAQMQNKGRLLAWDTSPKRLAQLPIRLKRAGVFNTEWRALTSESDAFIKRHKHTADRVLVDAPCSGSGTWRRNPDLKWRFTQKDLDEVMDAQKRILESSARLVKPGGRLIYATCSLLADENEKRIEDFLKTHSNFRVVCAKKIWNKTASGDGTGDSANEGSAACYLSLTPHQDGVDGFFAAVLERASAEASSEEAV